MKNSANKKLAEKYAERVWNKKDLAAIDDFVHPQVIIHSLLGDFHGLEPMKNIVHTWLKGFPDLHVSNNLVVCENDLVVIQWTAKGTHRGEFKGKKALGKSVSYSGVTIYRVHDTKIIEYWAYLDMNHLLNQI